MLGQPLDAHRVQYTSSSFAIWHKALPGGLRGTSPCLHCGFRSHVPFVATQFADAARAFDSCLLGLTPPTVGWGDYLLPRVAHALDLLSAESHTRNTVRAVPRASFTPALRSVVLILGTLPVFGQSSLWAPHSFVRRLCHPATSALPQLRSFSVPVRRLFSTLFPRWWVCTQVEPSRFL